MARAVRSWSALRRSPGGLLTAASMAALAAAVTASCALQAQAVDPPAVAASGRPSVDLPAVAWDEITALVGDAACSAEAQCRTVAVGSKACGGPAAYLAWSAARTDGTRLAAAAARHAELAREQQRQAGNASNCAIVVDPGATCRAARCQLRSGGSDGRQ